MATARKLAPVEEPVNPFADLGDIFQIEETPESGRTAKPLDAGIVAAITKSRELDVWVSIPITATPPMVRNKITTQDVKTASNYLRRCAASLPDMGISIKDAGNGRVKFIGSPKRDVPTGEARKPRTKKETAPEVPAATVLVSNS